jgi:hypothetical protein
VTSGLCADCQLKVVQRRVFPTAGRLQGGSSPGGGPCRRDLRPSSGDRPDLSGSWPPSGTRPALQQSDPSGSRTPPAARPLQQSDPSGSQTPPALGLHLRISRHSPCMWRLFWRKIPVPRKKKGQNRLLFFRQAWIFREKPSRGDVEGPRSVNNRPVSAPRRPVPAPRRPVPAPRRSVPDHTTESPGLITVSIQGRLVLPRR